ncbi:MAG: DUF4974 domain-containing protein [Ekhidna sp.]|nr:DUF4974 domain-containing protein [Ekhidna sp.]
MANDLKVYNHLKYQQDTPDEGDNFVEFLFENTELDVPPLDETEAWKNLQGKINRSSSSNFSWTKIAAAIAILTTLSISFLLHKPSVETLHIASSESNISVTFPDGSVGILNTNSSFSYPEIFGDSRDVVLEGEAYFDIKKSSKPFVIDVNGVDVKVLGTAFNLVTDDNEVRLYVDRGLVAFSRDGIETKVSAGNEAVFSKTDNTVELKEVVSPNIMSWRNGVFNFDNTPLDQVLADLSEFYNVEFQLSTEKLKSCKISASFNNQPLKEVLVTLSSILDVKTSTIQKTIKISGQGC